MAQDHKIASFVVINGKPNTAGNRHLAVFDILTAGLRICGCTLHMNADGIAFSHGPRGKHHSGAAVRVQFEDPAVSRAITRIAANAFTVLTGEELELE